MRWRIELKILVGILTLDYFINAHTNCHEEDEEEIAIEVLQ
jgi:hypothetical protein